MEFYLAHMPQSLFLEYFIVIFLGLVFGSFSTAMVYRIPRNIPWAFVKTRKDESGGVDKSLSAYRSACTQCKTPLRFLDLIPVFSWIFLLGKCRHCGTVISARYIGIEFGVVLICVLTYLLVGFSLEMFFLIACVPFLAALLMIDLEHMILPNELVLIVGGIGLLRFLPEFQGLDVVIPYIIAALSYGFFSWFLGWAMTKILKKEALGFGDVKFFAVAGLWLGLSALPWFCMLSGLFGVLFAGGWHLIVKNKLFPFGPALIAALYTLLLFDGSLLLQNLLP